MTNLLPKTPSRLNTRTTPHRIGEESPPVMGEGWGRPSRAGIAYMCMYTCINICMYLHIHTCMYTYLNIYIHTYIHTCMHACMHAYIHTYIHKSHVCLILYIYIYIYVCQVAASPGPRAATGEPENPSHPTCRVPTEPAGPSLRRYKAGNRVPALREAGRLQMHSGAQQFSNVTSTTSTNIAGKRLKRTMASHQPLQA